MNREKKEKVSEWSVRDEIGIIMLHHPPENYLEDPEFISLAFLKEQIALSRVKGLILHGKGRHFSAGAKIDKLLEDASDAVSFRQKIGKGKELLSFIRDLEIPVISAIKGVCFGGGLEIALAAHLRICSRNSLFAFPESNLNLIPGLGGIHRSLEISGLPGTLPLVLSGDVINAEDAAEIRLIDKVTDKDPFEEAMILLTKMTSGKPVKVINFVMRAIKNARTLSSGEALMEETKLFCQLASEEANRLSVKKPD